MKSVACAGLVAAALGLVSVCGAGSASAAPAAEVGGDGSYQVSNDDWGQMWPGTYTTSGPSGSSVCSWTIYSADGQIRSNDSSNFSADVSLGEGDVFDTRNCRSWVQASEPLESIVPVAVGSAAVGSAVGSAVLPGLLTLFVLDMSGE